MVVASRFRESLGRAVRLLCFGYGVPSTLLACTLLALVLLDLASYPGSTGLPLASGMLQSVLHMHPMRVAHALATMGVTGIGCLLVIGFFRAPKLQAPSPSEATRIHRMKGWGHRLVYWLAFGLCAAHLTLSPWLVTNGGYLFDEGSSAASFLYAPAGLALLTVLAKYALAWLALPFMAFGRYVFQRIQAHIVNGTPSNLVEGNTPVAEQVSTPAPPPAVVHQVEVGAAAPPVPPARSEISTADAAPAIGGSTERSQATGDDDQVEDNPAKKRTRRRSAG